MRNLVRKDPTDFEKAISKFQDNDETKLRQPVGLGVSSMVSRSTNDIQAMMSKPAVSGGIMITRNKSSADLKQNEDLGNLNLINSTKTITPLA